MRTECMTAGWMMVAVVALAAPVLAADKTQTVQRNAVAVQGRGSTSLTAPNAGVALPSAADAAEAPNQAKADVERRHRAMMNEFAARVSAMSPNKPSVFAAVAPPTLPAVPATPFAENDDGNVAGFAGLTNFQQRNAGTGRFANSQFNVEPPDQGLCVANGFVMEMVNDAVAVYSTRGTLLAGPTPLNQFFRLQPEVIRSNPPVFGEFTSDPRCLHDPGSNRWFATITETDTDGFTSHVMIAVSTGSNPTGAYNVYALDVTQDGDAGFCSVVGCFGDQPLIGTDANGFYISTNAFSFTFEGGQLYALSKAQLVAGGGVTGVHFGGISNLIPGIEVAFSLQPANSPPGDPGEPGTQYFLQANRVLQVERGLIVWAIGNTGALNANPLALTLQFQQVDSESYAFPVASMQQPGSTPNGEANLNGLELLDADDHRMQQVMFSRGDLYAALTTAASTSGQPVRNVAAYFVVSVNNRSGLQASIRHQGYVGGEANTFIMYPAMGVTAAGDATMVFSLSGARTFPSVGIWRPGDNTLHLTAKGSGADDGFSGYSTIPPFSRWGDYSAATVDEFGRIWFAGEYINSSPRTASANWGTVIGRISRGGPDENDNRHD